MNNEYFIIGSPKVPVWVQNELKSGKINQFENEDGEMITQLHTATKEYELYNGDVIIKGKYGLVGLPKEKATKYINPTKKEVNKDEQ